MKALILFIENPEHASLEPALDAEIPAGAAPRIYEALSNRLRNLTALFESEKYLYYSHYPNWNDGWDINTYRKRIQIGETLPERITNAIKDATDENPDAIVWTGAAAFSMEASDFERAIAASVETDVLIGETPDGDIALLGLSGAAFGLDLPPHFHASAISAAATEAGLRAVVFSLPGTVASLADLARLQISVD